MTRRCIWASFSRTCAAIGIGGLPPKFSNESRPECWALVVGLTVLRGHYVFTNGIDRDVDSLVALSPADFRHELRGQSLGMVVLILLMSQGDAMVHDTWRAAIALTPAVSPFDCQCFRIFGQAFRKS